MTSHDCVCFFLPPSFSLESITDFGWLQALDVSLGFEINLACAISRRCLPFVYSNTGMRNKRVFETWDGNVWELTWRCLRVTMGTSEVLHTEAFETGYGSGWDLAQECSTLGTGMFETWQGCLGDLVPECLRLVSWTLETSCVNVWDLSCKGLKTGTNEFETWQGLPLRTNTDE